MSSDGEYKADTVQKEVHGSPTTTGNAGLDDFGDINEKKLIRKIDWRLLPILGALYSIALIDRTNVSAAVHL